MFLGIEIGGTKLQLGVADGRSPEFVELVRLEVQPQAGATGILKQIRGAAPALVQRYGCRQIGIGFGGPVDGARGRVLKSHQIQGWKDFPLAAWCEQELGLPAQLGNDCDVAALAEARLGAGRGHDSVFYVTVGTGVGGGFVSSGRSFGTGRPAVAEIGHLRPGLHATEPTQTVEALASGWGLIREARLLLRSPASEPAGELPHGGDREDLLARCGADESRLDGRLLAEAAVAGNQLAQTVLNQGCRTLGWAIAQVLTLTAAEVVVVGGGVSLMGEELFFQPLRRYVAQYIFPPLADSYTIVPAALGERVVVCGAVALCEPHLPAADRAT